MKATHDPDQEPGAAMVDRFLGRISPDQARWMTDYVDHNEAGVAFHLLGSVLVNENVQLSDEDLRLLRQLGQRLDNANDPVDWEALEALRSFD